MRCSLGTLCVLCFVIDLLAVHAALPSRWKAKKPISAEQYRLYRARMGQCLGFDPAAAAPLPPQLKLLVVDRYFSSGALFVHLCLCPESCLCPAA